MLQLETGLSGVLRKILIQILSVVAAVFLSAIVIRLINGDPSRAFRALFLGSFGSINSISETLVKATPLILTGLSYSYAYRAGLINIGAEGQLYMGGFMAAWVGINLGSLPPAVHLPLALLAGLVGGGLWGLVVAVLKIRYGANEIITTVMLNYVAVYFISYLVTGPMIAPPGNNPESAHIASSAVLPRFISGSRVHLGIVIAILAVIVYYFFFRKLKVGYEARVVGKNMIAAKYAGIRSRRVMMLVMFVAGGMGGLAGAIEILGVQERLLQGFSPGYGFDGIAVALVGANSPVGIILGGILFGALRSGGNMMQMIARIPVSIIYLIQGFVILFVISGQMVSFDRVRKLKSFFSRRRTNV